MLINIFNTRDYNKKILNTIFIKKIIVRDYYLNKNFIIRDFCKKNKYAILVKKIHTRFS